MDFRYSGFFSPFPRNPLYRDFTVLTELRRGSEALATIAGSLMALEREMKKMRIGVHWAFQVAKTCTVIFLRQMIMIQKLFLQYPAVIPIFLHLHMLALNLWEVESVSTRSLLPESPFILFLIIEFAPGIFYLIAFMSDRRQNSRCVLSLGGSTASGVLNNISLTIFEHFVQLSQFGSKMIFLLSLMFLVIACSCRRHFKNCSNNGTDVLKICMLLAKISDSGSRGLGLSITATVILFLPYYALRLQDLFIESWALQFQYFYYVGNLVVFLGFSAEANDSWEVFSLSRS